MSMILGALLVLITLALWWLFNLPLWATIAIVSAVVVTAFAIQLRRGITARRSARRLEKALAEQGTQQVNGARPERRAEIQALQDQLQTGIAALKRSKLGGKSGASALYTMPWYMIIGPPGAGKTTALKHSGMAFPYTGASGGAVRGVGGTRNCDWWFTNEGILLDTAGRYATEQDDREEWLSFLHFLRKYRSKRPINGILLAISIAEVVDATEDQIEQTSKRLRQRIDEVMTELRMVVPVYVLFTKLDLVGGFSEFFGDLRKSERSQAWGTTLKLDAPKNDPGKVFDAEFDLLVENLHGRALKRLARERVREARERVFQFPIEFANVKRSLSALMAQTFAVNAFQGTPVLRGFYFTSGTQEGRPLDRVLQRMGQAMGIREGQERVQHPQPVESKSFFLHDVFMNIVFPDGDVAARSASDVRRRWGMRLAISGATLALAMILAIPGVNAAMNNNDLMWSTERLVKRVARIQWESPPGPAFEALDPALERLRELDEGPRVGYGWMMYRGDEYRDPAKAVYLKKVADGFVKAEIEVLEGELRGVDSAPTSYLRNRAALKAYLTLTEPNGEHPNLDVDYATERFAATWCARLEAAGAKELCYPTAQYPTGHVKPHLAYFFAAVKANQTTPPTRDDALVEASRRALQKISLRERYYAMFVDALIAEKYDASGDESYENLVFPPVTLARIFRNRPVLRPASGWIFDSKKRLAEKKAFEVDGPYTEKGHVVVFTQLEGAEKLLESEAWVVPLGDEERKPGAIVEAVAKIKDEYQSRFIKQWVAFLDDVVVRSPTTVPEALAMLEELTRSDYPLVVLLGAVAEHTQWPNGNLLDGRDALASNLNKRLQGAVSRASGGYRVDIDVSTINAGLSSIPAYFQSLTTFTTGSQLGGRTTPAGHIAYLDILKDLQKSLSTQKRLTSDVALADVEFELDRARGRATQLLATGFDPLTVHVLEAWILAPLTRGARSNVVPQNNPTSPPGVPGLDTPNPWIPKKP